MKTFKSFITEDIKTNEIDPSQFPNPLNPRMAAIFAMKGQMDGQHDDDVVKTKTNIGVVLNLNHNSPQSILVNH